MDEMRKKNTKLNSLVKNYLVTFFIMWLTATAIGSNIIGYFNIFSPYIIGSAFLYLAHILLYKYLSFKDNRIIKNILFFILPFILLISMYLLTIITLKPILEEFTIIKTTRLPCGDRTIKPKIYRNDFISGKVTSKFKLKRDNHTITWYPNEENYYKYKQGDTIKVKVKKNFLDMEVIVQQNRDKN